MDDYLEEYDKYDMSDCSDWSKGRSKQRICIP